MTTVKGNIFNALERGEIQVMLHVCNNKSVMGAGIALEVKTRYPNAYYNYVNYGLANGGLALGTISTSECVINLHAQDGYGNVGPRYVNYESLYVSLDRARDWCTQNRINSVGVPYGMGACRAGGDWNVVCAMVESAFDDSGINLTVYKL